MNITCIKNILFVFIFLLSACAREVQTGPPISTLPHPTEPIASFTEISLNTDPSLYGALAKSEINPLASNIHEAIFIKVMDGFIANKAILEYLIITSEVFPSSDGTLLAEITYNVRTPDSSWLVDGGIQATDNWIQSKCNRFDFVNTETEFQLRNRRTCN